MMTEYSSTNNNKLKTSDIQPMYNGQKIGLDQQHLNNYGFQDTIPVMNNENYYNNCTSGILNGQYITNHYNELMMPNQSSYYNCHGHLQNSDFIQNQSQLGYTSSMPQASNFSVENNKIDGYCTTPLNNGRYFGHENQNNENNVNSFKSQQNTKGEDILGTSEKSKKMLKSDKKNSEKSTKMKSSIKNLKCSKKTNEPLVGQMGKNTDSLSFEINSGELIQF